jgi:heme iron utilization protein
MADNEADATRATEPGFDAKSEAKLLLRATRSGALATLAAGYPFASLVNVATYYDGSPILLLSQLANHTRHLAADPRLSLLLGRTGRGDPLAHPRLTLVGRAEKIDDPARRTILRARFLNRHPKSALYADFADFAFYQVSLEQGHLNGGFARAAAFDGDALLTKITEAADLIATEPAAIGHINADHSTVPALLAQAFGRRGTGHWRATGFDPEGLDLGKDDEICRVTFPAPVASGAELRQVLMDLAAKARRCLADAESAARPGI